MALFAQALLGLLPAIGLFAASFVALATVFMLTVCSTFLLTSFTIGDRRITTPICFVVLFAAGLYSSQVSREVPLGGAGELKSTIVYAIPGQCVAAFLLLLVLGRSPSDRQKG